MKYEEETKETKKKTGNSSGGPSLVTVWAILSQNFKCSVRNDVAYSQNLDHLDIYTSTGWLNIDLIHFTHYLNSHGILIIGLQCGNMPVDNFAITNCGIRLFSRYQKQE